MSEPRPRLIGHWLESLTDEQNLLPQEVVGPLLPDEDDAAVRRKVVAYLRSAPGEVVYRGYSDCRFRCGAEDEEMGHSEYRNAGWAWPEGLVHYVEHHGICLPEPFVRMVWASESLPPASRELGPALVDPAFWAGWCQEQRHLGLHRRRRELVRGDAWQRWWAEARGAGRGPSEADHHDWWCRVVGYRRLIGEAQDVVVE